MVEQGTPEGFLMVELGTLEGFFFGDIRDDNAGPSTTAEMNRLPVVVA